MVIVATSGDNLTNGTDIAEKSLSRLLQRAMLVNYNPADAELFYDSSINDKQILQGIGKAISDKSIGVRIMVK